MQGTQLTKQASYQWAIRAVSSLVVLVLALPWVVWFFDSPMMRLSDKFFGQVFFPADGPEDRFQYFRNLVIHRGERVRFATCVLCSVTVNASVDTATALWGDVTIGSGGYAGGIEVVGGRINALPGSGMGAHSVHAVGGPVNIANDVKFYRFNTSTGLRWAFYPGQRFLTVANVTLFVIFILVAAACGGQVASGSFREFVDAGVRRPTWSAVLGLVSAAVAVPLLSLAVLVLYIFPALGFILYFAVPTVYWCVLVIGFAALAEWIGSMLGNRNRLTARLMGAALLSALMIVPILGLFVLLLANLVSLGAGGGVLLWRRFPRLRAAVSKVVLS